jgi:hypothetical protein
LTGQKANFVAILFLALAVRFNIAVNICHLLSCYFLELLQIFVDFNTSVLSTLIKLILTHRSLSTFYSIVKNVVVYIANPKVVLNVSM